MEIHFHPWVGTNYGTSSIFGMPLLILGEAYYEWRPGVDTPDLTKQLVAEDASGEWRHRHHTIVFKTVTGERLTWAGSNLFWHSVAYYNYVQQMVGNKPGIAPRRHMWHEAQQPFFTVLRQLKPACLLVLGQRLWEHLPVAAGAGPVLRVNNEMMETRFYHPDGGNLVLAGRIDHPASRGFRPAFWHAWVIALIREAKHLQSPPDAGRNRIAI